ncbi:MAG: hypothetical protein WCY62_02345 [Clostridia bacterium]
MNVELDKVYDYNRQIPDHQKLRGIIFRVEPYLSDEWDSDRDYVMNRYFYNMKRTVITVFQNRLYPLYVTKSL